jgi:hypothetical protein
LSESFANGFLADNLARISRVSPSRLWKNDDLGREEFKYSLNITGHTPRKYCLQDFFDEVSIDLT